ncbi:unnamed protein product [Anisakis simplex]|uniref:CNNM transmembrane domain-containing protein n=1 Tax=Anisakis simplex TaxID=6269 RepID=A0A0M3K5V8_ANISI|nr:unnamed protein product [Anisakis simplex]
MTNLLKPTDPEKAREHQEYITRIHEHPIFSFCNSTRYVIMVLSIICLAWLMGNSLVLNFTIICMSDDGGTVNGTNGTSGGLYHYTHSQQSWLFAIVAIGSIAGTYPVMFLETRATLRFTFEGLTLFEDIERPQNFFPFVLPLIITNLGEPGRSFSEKCSHCSD